jgi:hypothetical protein
VFDDERIAAPPLGSEPSTTRGVVLERVPARVWAIAVHFDRETAARAGEVAPGHDTGLIPHDMLTSPFDAGDPMQDPGLA